jgi:hypothetical protein
VNCQWQFKGILTKNKGSKIYGDGRTYDNKLYTFKEGDYHEIWQSLAVLVKKVDNVNSLRNLPTEKDSVSDYSSPENQKEEEDEKLPKINLLSTNRANYPACCWFANTISSEGGQKMNKITFGKENMQKKAESKAKMNKPLELGINKLKIEDFEPKMELKDMKHISMTPQNYGNKHSLLGKVSKFNEAPDTNQQNNNCIIF